MAIDDIDAPDIGMSRHRDGRSNNNLSQAVRTVENLVFLLDTDLCIRWINPAAERKTGYFLSDIMAQPIGLIFELSSAEEKNELAFAGRVAGRAKSGQMFWAELAIDPIRNGAIAIAYVHDLADQVQSKISTEHEFLSQLIETSPTGIMALDGEGIVLFANNEACNLLSIGHAKLIGHPIFEQPWQIMTLTGEPYSADDRPLWQVLFRRAFVRNARVKISWPDGHSRFMCFNASPTSGKQTRAKAVVAFSDVTDAMRQAEQSRLAVEQAQRAASQDPLTSLPNRATFREKLEMALTAAQRDGLAVALIFIDLDHFKTINDSLGHDTGDRAIQEVTRRFVAAARDGDTVARIGGDEFAVLVPLLFSVDDAFHVLDQLFEALRAPLDLEGQTIYINASMGITFFPNDAISADLLLQNADLAMYRAKLAGRNSYSAFSADLRRDMSRRVAVAQSLRRGLHRDAFQLVLQPNVALNDPGHAVGAEALLRWQDPFLGEISPEEFIPIAEAAGLIRTIDLRVVALLGPHVARWRDLGRAVPISFNLSALSLQTQGFSRVLLEAFASAGIRAGEVRIELTETGLMKNIQATAANIGHLHDAGYPTALDDFGTGHSSLAYLQRLPLGALKIDKSFIATVGCGDARSDAIVRAIITLADALGLRTIAEGIEESHQHDWLAAEGCALGQGRYYSPPMDISNFERRYF